MTAHSLQLEDGLIAIRSLKKRNQHHVREVPIPKDLVADLTNQIHAANRKRTDTARDATPEPNGNILLWQNETGGMVDRITAYRWVKQVMAEAAIHGPQASPKGLRHGYGIHAIRSGIQLNMVQKWMGHASIKTTAIYVNAVGREEIELAERMWT